MGPSMVNSLVTTDNDQNQNVIVEINKPIPYKLF